MSAKESFRSVLIFGGAGFIGSNLAASLLDGSEAKVHIFDNLSRQGVRHNLTSLEKLAGRSKRLQITVADIRDAEMVERAARHATEVYHFAAQVAVTTSIVDPRLDFDVNLAGTFNILEVIRKSGNSPFLLFTSTNKVYGELGGRADRGDTSPASASFQGVSESQPLDFHSPYGCSKGAADQYVRDYARIYGLNAVVFRMSCIAGPRQFGTEDQGWIAHFLYSALEEVPVTIYGDGLQVRDVLYIDDLLRAFGAVRRLPPSKEGRIYNIGGGPANAISLLDLAALIEQLTGYRLDLKFEAARPGDQPVYVTDFQKLNRETGWQPTTNIRDTLESMQRWWKRNRQIFVAAKSSTPRIPSTLALPRTA